MANVTNNSVAYQVKLPVEVMRFARKDWFRRSCCRTDHANLEHNFSTLNFNRQFNHIQSGSLHTAHLILPTKTNHRTAVTQVNPFVPKDASYVDLVSKKQPTNLHLISRNVSSH